MNFRSIQSIVATIVFIVSLITFSSCQDNNKSRIGGPYYFESFANYEIPFRPVGELTPEEAKKRDSYYIAYFDKQGNIISFTKYLYGEMEFSDKYIYNSEGYLERREMTGADGAIKVQYFDTKGEIIESKED